MKRISTDHKVDWRQPYIEYLTKGTLPDDRYEANKLKKMAKRYIVNDGKLFKRGNSGILLRCLSGDEAMEVMHQSHAGTLASTKEFFARWLPLYLPHSLSLGIK